MFNVQGNIRRIHFVRLAGCGEGLGRARRGMNDDDGQTLVEMALTCSVLFAVFFGIIEMCLALYVYNYVAEAAREATRYAVIRGSSSCQVNTSFPNCNLNPLTSGSPAAGYTTTSPLQTYIQSLGFPYSSGLTATATWYTPSVDAKGSTTWPAANSCAGTVDGSGNPCNQPGNAVKVTVSYAFPLAIPFWGYQTLTVHSSSEMMISE